MKFRLVLLLVCVFAGSVFGKDTLTIGMRKPPQLPLHPMLVADKSSSYIQYMTADPLAVLNSKGVWECRLCKEFPALDNHLLESIQDPDIPYGLKISLELRKGAFWGDGQPVTGKDFFFTWQVAKDVERNFPGKTFLTQIDHVVVDPNNERRVTLFFRRIQYFHDEVGSIFLLPQHLEAELWSRCKEAPDSYFTLSKYLTEPENPGLYNGPFVVKSSKTPGKLVLRRNAHFQRSSGMALQEISVLTLKPDTEKEWLGLGVELIPESEYAWESSARSESLPGLAVVLGDKSEFEQIAFNLRNPILRDIKVRKALAYALDKEKILAAMEALTPVPAVSPIHPAHSAFTSDLAFYAYDPAKAKKLLDQSQWFLSSSKKRMKNNRPLILTLTTNQDPLRTKALELAVADWKKVGIEVQLKAEKASEYEDTLEKMRYEAMIVSVLDLPFETSFWPLFHSDAIPNIRNSYSGENISGWNSRRVDHLLDALEVEFQPHRRQQLLQDLQKLYAEQLPGIPLFFHTQKAFVHPDLGGFTIPGNQFPSSITVSEWVWHAKALGSVQ